MHRLRESSSEERQTYCALDSDADPANNASPMRSLALVFALAACADASPDGTGEAEVAADATTVAGTELNVRAGDTTLWIRHDVTRSGDNFVLHGRTSRNLTGGNGFVFDDPYGDFSQPSARTFELTWPVSTARTLADGVDQFVALSFTHSAGRPDSLTGRIVVRPRLASFTGSSKIYLTAELLPVVVGGSVAYRIAGKSTGTNQGVRAVVDGLELSDVRRLDDSRFEIDLAPDQAFALTAGGEIQVIVAFATGGVEKHARLGLGVKKIGMTSGDAELVWPRPTCTASMRSCLTSLPDGTIDLARCGEAIKVNACTGVVGVFVDDVSMQAALHTADTRLATTSARADATALAGADRADAFLFGAKQTVESRLEGLFGRWYLSATARGAALDGALETGIDIAYARPLDVIEPHVAVPGNAAAMRQVAADAVLAELAVKDFLHSEFARTLEALTHEFRAGHVADIRAFRETVVPEPYPGMPSRDVYVGSWLGLHTEVVIERATGQVVSTLVEID